MEIPKIILICLLLALAWAIYTIRDLIKLSKKHERIIKLQDRYIASTKDGDLLWKAMNLLRLAQTYHSEDSHFSTASKEIIKAIENELDEKSALKKQKTDNNLTPK